MTLRQLLHAVDFDDVYLLINKKDSRNGKPKPLLEITTSAYTHVIQELLSKPKVRAYPMPIIVNLVADWFDKKRYANVSFHNPKYVAPKKGLKPWGGPWRGKNKNKNIPKGYYNVNDGKHSKTFSMAWTPWSKIIDTPVINGAGFSNEQLAAEILWEITFYGWTEEKVSGKITEIKGNIKQAKDDVKKGKFVELPPKKKGGFKIVIPDTVSQQIIDIANENKRGS